MDLDDIFSLPFGLGEQFHAAANLIPRARKGDEDEYFMPPLAIPKVCTLEYVFTLSTRALVNLLG